MSVDHSGASSSDATGPVDVRRQRLEARLRDLHYTDSLDSCDLVERLLDDILKSVENFETLARRYDQNVRKLQDATAEAVALRAENQRLSQSLKLSATAASETDAFSAPNRSNEKSTGPEESGTLTPKTGTVPEKGGGGNQDPQIAVLIAELREERKKSRQKDKQLRAFERSLEEQKNSLAKSLMAENLRLKQKVELLECDKSELQEDGLTRSNSREHLSAISGTMPELAGTVPEVAGTVPSGKMVTELTATLPLAVVEQMERLERQLRIERARNHHFLEERSRLLKVLSEKDRCQKNKSSEASDQDHRIKKLSMTENFRFTENEDQPAAPPTRHGMATRSVDAPRSRTPDTSRSAPAFPSTQGWSQPSDLGSSDAADLMEQVRHLKEQVRDTLRSKAEALQNVEIREAHFRSCHDAIKRRCANMQQSLDEKTAEVESLRSKAADLDQQLARQEEMAGIFESRCEMLARRLNTVSAAATDNSRRLENEIRQLQTSLDNRSTELHHSKNLIGTLQRRVENLELCCRQLMDAVLLARQAAAEAEEEKEHSIQHFRSILEQKENEIRAMQEKSTAVPTPDANGPGPVYVGPDMRSPPRRYSPREEKSDATASDAAAKSSEPISKCEKSEKSESSTEASIRSRKSQPPIARRTLSGPAPTEARAARPVRSARSSVTMRSLGFRRGLMGASVSPRAPRNGP